MLILLCSVDAVVWFSDFAAIIAVLTFKTGVQIFSKNLGHLKTPDAKRMTAHTY
jgi:hypothetical protein